MAKLASDNSVSQGYTTTRHCLVCDMTFEAERIVSLNRVIDPNSLGELGFQLCSECEVNCKRLKFERSGTYFSTQDAIDYLRDELRSADELRKSYESMVWQQEGGDSYSEPHLARYSAKLLYKESRSGKIGSDVTAVFELLVDVKVWPTENIRFRKGDRVKCVKSSWDTDNHWIMDSLAP